MIQVDCFLKCQPETDIASTWTAADMAENLLVYLNGRVGSAALRQRGYGALRMANIRIGHDLTDSERYQLHPGFDMIIRYNQCIASNIGATDKISGKLKGV